MDAEAGPLKRATRLLGVGHCFEEVAADNPEQVHVAVRGPLDHFGRRPSPLRLHRESPRVGPPCGGVRVHARHAAHLGAALHAGVPANRYQPTPLPANESTGETHVDERRNGLDAVRVLGEAHGPDEDGVRLVHEQPREGTHGVGGRSALGLEIRPGR